MGNTIDISQLKSGATPPTPDKNEGKNIDGQDLRDFGGGLKEFDPTANGFEPEKVEFSKSDKDKALELTDVIIKECNDLEAIELAKEMKWELGK